MYVDGPFGAGQQDWVNYDVSVLVGGGIGVTPYASIIKDFVFHTSVKNTFRVKCRKVRPELRFHVPRDTKSFVSFLPHDTALERYVLLSCVRLSVRCKPVL